MENLAQRLRHRNLVSGFIAIAIITSIVLGCTCSDDDTAGGRSGVSESDNPIPKPYWGEWIGEDDSTMAIRADGTGDYASSGLKISGGSVAIDESARTLSISFLLLGKTLKIDRAPENRTMVLDGIVYTRKGQPDAELRDVPSAEDSQTIARKTILGFNAAVQKKDFGEFHDSLARPFRKETSPERLAEIFKDFLKGGFKFNSESDANFTDAPAIVNSDGYEVLQLNGYYPTTPRRTKFEFKYVFEEGEWKLIGLRINTKD